MPISEVHICHHAYCQRLGEYTDKEVQTQFNMLVRGSNEQRRSLFALVEASWNGCGVVCLLSLISWMDKKAIERGQQEIRDSLTFHYLILTLTRAYVFSYNPSISVKIPWSATFEKITNLVNSLVENEE